MQHTSGLCILDDGCSSKSNGVMICETLACFCPLALQSVHCSQAVESSYTFCVEDRDCEESVYVVSLVETLLF